MSKERILVGIASYRDPELLKTIQDCLAKAKHPDRVNFAVINQYDDSTRFMLHYFNNERLKLINIHHLQSHGVGYARRLMTDLWGGEDFVLQIDAHTRFESDWDEILLQQWYAINDQRAVFSAHPIGYSYEEDGSESMLHDDHIGKIKVDKFAGDIPIFKGERHKPAGDLSESIVGVAAGFIFGPGAVFGVPYIREICFMGEEFARAFQLYSHGFNLYSPRRLPVRHLYYRKDTRFWHDLPSAGKRSHYDEMTARSYAFVRSFLRGDLSNYHAYFGPERTLEQFEEYIGVRVAL
ncbi:UDP-N-acetylglucosamine-transferase [Candidatus Saccharibacteria bacterium]|nr:UDP-N-acetylglucosamine-transferase [Candidatus Saccharibacteria bacterium]